MFSTLIKRGILRIKQAISICTAYQLSCMSVVKEGEGGQSWQQRLSQEGGGTAAGRLSDEEILSCVDPKHVTKLLQSKASAGELCIPS